MTSPQIPASGPRSVSGRWRWLVPPVLAGVVVAGALVIPEAASASGRPSLKAITPAALVAKVLTSHVSTLSGTLSLTANLGLGDLSGLAGDGVNPLSLLSGTHTAQVFYDGPSRIRVAVPAGNGEDDLVMNGNTIYLWQSGPYTVTKIVLPAPGTQSVLAIPHIPTIQGLHSVGCAGVSLAKGHAVSHCAPVPPPIQPSLTAPAVPRPPPIAGKSVSPARHHALRVGPIPGGVLPIAPMMPPTPAQIAAKLLAHIGPTTAVKVATTAFVAGRAVYQLVLSPRTAKSLIGQIVLSVDAATGLPLRVQVVPRGSTAAVLTYGFTKISYATPAASNFDFTPPKGAKVTTINPMAALSGPGGLSPSLGVSPTTPQGSITSVNGSCPALCHQVLTQVIGRPSSQTPRIVGNGWATVVVIPAPLLGTFAKMTPPGNTKAAAHAALNSFLSSGTPLSGTWGKGHLIHTALLNVLALTDGPILVGAVTPATLEAAAAHAH